MERKGQLERAAKRADKWVKDRYPSLTGKQIEEAFVHGLITGEGGRRVSKGLRTDRPDALDDHRLESHLADLRRGNPSLSISVLEERREFLLIDKPAGVPSHPLSLFDRDTVTHWAFSRYPDILGEFPAIQPALVPHRLDTGTSGLMVVARTRKSFEQWRERFQRKEVRKRYLAWCWGAPSLAQFDIASSIAHAPGETGKMVTPSNGEKYVPPVMEAQSLVKVRLKDSARGCFLAEVTCHSGVTHQVRVHLASRGFPLLGDSLYDPEFAERALRQGPHLLRAFELTVGDESWRAETDAFSTIVEQRWGAN